MATSDRRPILFAARTELADLVSEAAGELSDLDHTMLDLAYRHGLDGSELAEALGLSPASARAMSHRMREIIERNLGALLLAWRGRLHPDRCADLSAILNGWDGQFTILMRKRIARHVDSCTTCDQDRRQLISPAALLGGGPVFIPAPLWLRARTLGVALLGLQRKGTTWGT
ncbi:hypothetical protein BOO86_13200 [Mycobacterium sp. CBMA 234]|uniref:hypothetical protein n=1 Tax=Mycolicibacterium sp. CBMA 234 TaxID=1918495 RepID=UPI0012DD846E|nr:hypothetical protein [Mycolicibacterium sp. CBMA 234]MUL65428.1 hypothetical protein [Mycolicibacterium sp. CBMA 234]